MAKQEFQQTEDNEVTVLPTEAELKNALRHTVLAWEHLDEGSFTAKEINDWLRDHLFPAIENARRVLGVIEGQQLKNTEKFTEE